MTLHCPWATLTVADQIALFNAIGAWLAAVATFLAVIVSLWLATRGNKVKLRFDVALYLMFTGDGSEPIEHLAYKVANLGDRPVTINGIGWVVGSRWRKKKQRHALQTLNSPYSVQIPKQLNHGDSATFLVSLQATPHWAAELGRNLVCDARDLKTLRGQVYTTVGQTIEAKPSNDLIKLIAKSMVGDEGLEPPAYTV